MESSVWASFGLRLREADKKQVQQAASLLKGGLKVIAVKKGSPADRAGIRTGDILVGLHEWEILSLQHVAWVLARDGFQNLLPIRFYIVRDNQLRVGRIESD
jgi:serine protease Do